MTYIGRFAPSPTGNLHFGSLVSAVASFTDAHFNQGKWLVRIEDMDPPREQQDAANAILKCLEHYQLHWDGEVLFQSQNHHRYQHYLQQLAEDNLLFACDCTRSRLRTLNTIYDGHCRHLSNIDKADCATRLMLNFDVQWNDYIQGEKKYDYQAMGGDFIVVRRDKLISYQIAVSVDDYEQGINRVVRGADLLDSTARQLYLMQCLHLPQPEYAHVPMATHNDGNKLSKQTAAPELLTDQLSIRTNLFKSLVFLNQNPPAELMNETPSNILIWAISHWNIGKVPKTLSQIAL